MNHGTKLLLALILVPVAIFLGLKGYIRHNVKSALEQVTAMAGPFVSIRYGGIGSSLSGSITIENVKLQPTGLTDVIPIRALTIETPGLGYLLTAKKKLANGDFPERLRIAITGLQLDLASPMLSSLDQFLSMAAQSRAVGARSTTHCGGIRYFGPREYRKLGYEALDMDIAVGYQIEKGLGRALVTVDWKTRDMAQLETTLTFTGNEAVFRPGTPGNPELTAVTAVYKDLSYMDRVKRYCAAADGVSVEEYVRAVSEEGDGEFAAIWGFAPGPGLRAAFREFIDKPGEVRIEAHPADGFDPRTLSLFTAQDAVAMLNLRLHVNGREVTDLSFRTDVTPTARSAATHDGAPASVVPPVPGSQPAPAPEPPGYRPVKTETLAQYIGRDVRVLAAGRQREGVLAEVQAKSITIERGYGGGSMTFAVPINQIHAVEVRF